MPKKQLVVLGERYRSVLELPLKNQDLIPIFLPDCPWVDPRVAGHGDLMVQPVGEDTWIAESGIYPLVSGLMKSYGQQVICGEASPGRNYPEEARYDGLLLGKKFFHNPRCTDQKVKEYLEQQGIRFIAVKQGYASCACGVAAPDRVITADHGMADCLEREGIHVLRISSGGIALPGYESGFIGGALFSFGDGRVYVTGRMDHLPDYQTIMEFLEKVQLTLVTLTSFPVFDCGITAG